MATSLNISEKEGRLIICHSISTIWCNNLDDLACPAVTHLGHLSVTSWITVPRVTLTDTCRYNLSFISVGFKRQVLEMMICMKFNGGPLTLDTVRSHKCNCVVIVLACLGSFKTIIKTVTKTRIMPELNKN